MKRIIIVIVLLLNLLPYMEEGKFNVGNNNIYAQAYGGEDGCQLTIEPTPKELCIPEVCVSACSVCYVTLSCSFKGTHCSSSSSKVELEVPDFNIPDINIQGGDFSNDNREDDKDKVINTSGGGAGGGYIDYEWNNSGGSGGNSIPSGSGGGGGNDYKKADCQGVINGNAFIDACGRCVGGNTGKVACWRDCNGDENGKAYYDDCYLCVGGNTGKLPCEKDCNGNINGTAYYDDCGECVGGKTGKTPCKKDCNGDKDGEAFIDPCGKCVGGKTGRNSCIDCNGEKYGTATLNACDECVGGNTGRRECEPCIPQSFNYGMNISPIPMNSKYAGSSWCGFLTLATIKGGDPCIYARDYYRRHKSSLKIVGCNSTRGIDPKHVIQFYIEHGMSFGTGTPDECYMVNGVSGGGKGIFYATNGHICLFYNFSRSRGDEVDDIVISKYDTNDKINWDRDVSYKEVSSAISTGRVISK